MRFTSALLVLAYALHVQAWRFDIQSMFQSGPRAFLRRPSQDNQAALRQRRGNSRFLPDKQGNILEALEVLRVIGEKIAVLGPVPTNMRSEYIKGNYKIECIMKNGMLLRTALTRKKLEPLTAVKDDSYLDGTDRQRGRVRKGDIVIATKCRPRKGADGKLTFTCICTRRGRRGNKNRNRGAAGTS